MLSENLARWIFASLTKHFDANKGSYVLFIEGQRRDLSAEEAYFEVRIDGPVITEVSRHCYRVSVTVNILCTSAMNDSDFHRIHAMAGYIASKYTTIGVFKYGIKTGIPPEVNDDSLIGCLNLMGALVIKHFGQLRPDVPLLQASVEGVYENLFDFN